MHINDFFEIGSILNWTSNFHNKLLQNDKMALVSGFYANELSTKINRILNETKYISNFNDQDSNSFWNLIETYRIHLTYERKSVKYSEWDQFLGPLMLSNYDKMHFHYKCLKGT